MTPEEKGWKDVSLNELDLELENQALELDLQIQGGLVYKGKEAPPELVNQFLHNVKDSESRMAEAAKTNLPVLSIFPPNFSFPPADQMCDDQILRKLKEIRNIFTANNIELGLVDGLPESLLYTNIIEDVLEEVPFIPYGPDSRFTYVIECCDGYCSDCFQRDFCTSSSAWDEGS